MVRTHTWQTMIAGQIEYIYSLVLDTNEAYLVTSSVKWAAATSTNVPCSASKWCSNAACTPAGTQTAYAPHVCKM